MAEVVLFHHVLGLTPGVIAFADRLREAGHRVHTPDLFDGHTFDTLEAGLRYAKSIGFDQVTARAVAAANELPEAVVYAGFSLGVAPAQKLAQTRQGARGALLFHACLPVSEFSNAWPDGVPVQIHAMDQDPFFVDDGDIEEARSLVEQAEHATLFTYTGTDHLFADSSLPSYDETATNRLTERVLSFLAKQPV